MDVKDGEAERQILLADLASLAAAAARPPDTPWPKATSEAISRFYDRFKRRAYAYCSRRIRFSLPYDHSLEDFVTDLFLRFIRSADKFKLGNALSVADIERQILSSLHKHAVWQLDDILKSAKRDRELFDAIVRDIARQAPSVDGGSSPEVTAKRAQIQDTLARADERTRDVLLTSYGHTDHISGKFTLPPEVRAELCRRCNFGSTNAMVKFRSRKIEELRALFT